MSVASVGGDVKGHEPITECTMNLESGSLLLLLLLLLLLPLLLFLLLCLYLLVILLFAFCLFSFDDMFHHSIGLVCFFVYLFVCLFVWALNGNCFTGNFVWESVAAEHVVFFFIIIIIHVSVTIVRE